ncbi:PAP phosphatase [Metamycoplasma hyosynoviae]|uniref:PAP phosphatase n=1 Tax=Metamycoplasma hyosynoviae TaxID=29559 RepID=A0A4P1QG87_9BACT|nr:bifunctional oligoribonuclease/PAP phosphatase NrnA [Metamycoplasma hyosynoviae]ASI53874.1 PAP phosphatase [Metamycoplasma hyosynoviae]MDD1360300.1 bifunctional oligoribonuclease/PAP phosphatase NrnA [Metamycoplasma hyosynoviae]
MSLTISQEKLNLFKAIEEKIKTYETIVVFHHIRPDGDCLGSQFGMKNLILENFPKKKVLTVGNSKGSFSYLDFKMDEIKNKPIKNSLAIIVDANFKERLECRELLDNKIFTDVIRIDHHPNDDDLYASIRWVEPEAPAAAQQVAELALGLNWKINELAATYLYLGIYTDSVRLTTNSTSSKTMYIVSELWKAGAKKDLIHTEMAKKTLQDIRVNAFIQQNMQIEKQVVWFYFTLEDQNKMGILDPLQGNRPSTLASIDDNKIWVFFTQEKENQIRCEFRSNGACVRNVAIKWGGGGHHRASGAQIHNSAYIPLIIKDCQAEVLNTAEYE